LDFAVFGAMLLGAGIVYAFARRKTRNSAYRAAVGVALGSAFLLVWINGAVGILGDEDDVANMMFFGVLGIGAVGAAVCRFEARGMMLALAATACAQLAVAVVALAAGLGSTSPSWPQHVLVLTALFVVMWLGSAWLFRSAAREQSFTK
jgi:peptidoglycan/LPS O-acetylase OafA/YrhL